jgi:hypothetical protein
MDFFKTDGRDTGTDTMTTSEIYNIRVRLREACRVYANLCPGESYLSWLSSRVEFSVGVLRAFRLGKYGGDNERIAQAIKDVWGE